MKSSKFISFLLILVVLVLVGVYFFQSNTDDEVTLETPEVAMLEAGDYQVIPSQSEIGWFGEKKLVPGSHAGMVAVSEGAISIDDAGGIENGYVVIDMSAILLEEGDTGGQRVLDHLASADFFSVATYPTARLDVLSSRTTEAGLEIEGSLTIKESTQPITFMAVPAMKDNATVAFVGEFTFDRSLYDVRFGSESFFGDLGDDIIKDEVVITFNLVAAPEA